MFATRWTADTPGLVSAAKWDWTNQAWVYLAVEKIPDGDWDWTAWSSIDNRTSLHGAADDQVSAMALAEHAAALIAGVRVLDPV